jgi:hypothetical protein
VPTSHTVTATSILFISLPYPPAAFIGTTRIHMCVPAVQRSNPVRCPPATRPLLHARPMPHAPSLCHSRARPLLIFAHLPESISLLVLLPFSSLIMRRPHLRHGPYHVHPLSFTPVPAPRAHSRAHCAPLLAIASAVFSSYCNTLQIHSLTADSLTHCRFTHSLARTHARTHCAPLLAIASAVFGLYCTALH